MSVHLAGGSSAFDSGIRVHECASLCVCVSGVVLFIICLAVCHHNLGGVGALGEAYGYPPEPGCGGSGRGAPPPAPVTGAGGLPPLVLTKRRAVKRSLYVAPMPKTISRSRPSVSEGSKIVKVWLSVLRT